MANKIGDLATVSSQTINFPNSSFESKKMASINEIEEIIEDDNSEDEYGEKTEITDPKLFKSTLCQFYLKGPCKNGDTCTYAHGTSELRTADGNSVADLENSSDKKVLFKTTLCAKFVTYGDCPFGPACNFAHGVKELRQALEASSMAKDEDDKVRVSFSKNNIHSIYTSKNLSYSVINHTQFKSHIFHLHIRI